MAKEKSFEIIESEGDLFLSDVVLDAGQRAICGRCQNAQLELSRKEEELAGFLDQVKAAQEEVAKWKAKVYQVMEQTGAKKIESAFMTITRVNPTQRVGIDAKKLQAVDPALYEKVFEKAGKTTKVAGYAKITPKPQKRVVKVVEGEVLEEEVAVKRGE